MDYLALKANTSELANYIKKDGTKAMTSNLNLNSNKIINLATPTSNNDASTKKKYVDDQTPYFLDSTGNYNFNNKFKYNVRQNNANDTVVNNLAVNNKLNNYINERKL